jgi:hypothetical protein
VIPRLWRRLGQTFVSAQARGEWRGFLSDRKARSRSAAMALAAGALLLFTWPTSPVLTVNHGPFAYTAVGTIVVLMTAYLGFVQGIRMLPAEGRFTAQQWAAFVPLSPQVYLHGAIIGRMLDPLFFLVIVTPILLPAAALEGVNPPMLGAALLVLALTALTGRMSALALLLWLEHRPALLIPAVHAAMWVPFLAGWVWPPLSPLSAFYETFAGRIGAGASLGAAWPAFLAVHAAINGALYGLCSLRVRALRRQPASQAPAPAGAAEGMGR